jgi:hypothetical protein
MASKAIAAPGERSFTARTADQRVLGKSCRVWLAGTSPVIEKAYLKCITEDEALVTPRYNQTPPDHFPRQHRIVPAGIPAVTKIRHSIPRSMIDILLQFAIIMLGVRYKKEQNELWLTLLALPNNASKVFPT